MKDLLNAGGLAVQPLFDFGSQRVAEAISTADFSLWRNDWFACGCRLLAEGALIYHRIRVEGGERIPRQGPALLLPKHCAYRDILVEGVALHRLTQRYATYVMKVGLSGFLEWAGGVKIVRPKDLRRIADRQQRRAQIRWARDKNEQTLNYLAWLYRQGEVVVSHPEGMRYQDQMGVMQKEIVDHLMWVEERWEMRVPIIPIGLEYESYSKPGSRVFFRVGEPMYTDNLTAEQLVAELGQRIGDLSGFQKKG